MDTNPCYSCITGNCQACEHRIYANTKAEITDDLIEMLWKELTDIAFVEDQDFQFVLDQPWRGFPVGEFTMDDWFGWVDHYHSKGVGFVYENIGI